MLFTGQQCAVIVISLESRDITFLLLLYFAFAHNCIEVELHTGKFFASVNCGAVWYKQWSMKLERSFYVIVVAFCYSLAAEIPCWLIQLSEWVIWYGDWVITLFRLTRLLVEYKMPQVETWWEVQWTFFYQFLIDLFWYKTGGCGNVLTASSNTC